MIFFDCQTAPSPRLVRMFIAEKGAALEGRVEVRQVDLKNREQLSDAFRAINPNCTVPSLKAGDGEIYTTTQGCMRYLEEIAPEPPLLGRTPQEKGLIADLNWRMSFNGFQAVAEALRNTAKGMKDRAVIGPVNYAQIPELGERGRLRTRQFLDGFEELIGGKPYLAGKAFSAADIMALVIIDFAGWLKETLPEDAPHARRWYEEVSARPSAKL